LEGSMSKIRLPVYCILPLRLSFGVKEMDAKLSPTKMLLPYPSSLFG
jgi:hypothetical protein